MQSSALFLDRDGVINVNHGYVHKRTDFQFIEGIFDLAKEAAYNNRKIVVITNQSGICRGYYTEQQFDCLMKWMCEQFYIAGSPIERVYFSPYHPTEGIGKYLKDDYSRKPHPGMILKAQKELEIDLVDSVLIGDAVSDIRAGNAAGIGTNLLLGFQEPIQLFGLEYKCINTLREALPFMNNEQLLRGVE